MDESLHYTSANHADSLISSINRLRCDRQLCDVILIINDYRIPVHRLVLSACSPYFQNILDTSWDFGVKELVLRNVSGEAVQMIIEFCYTSTISVTEDTVWMILPVAFTFQLDELVNLCCDFISSLIKNETCLQSHTLAVQCDCSDLRQLSANFIQDNFESILEDDYFHELPVNIFLNHLKLLHEDVLIDDQILQCLRSWVKYSPDERRNFTAMVRSSNIC
ncbi:kelch-like protein 20 isoform X2 [Patella vulgata]|uniref:kelch-like protein 20 isoform X2 n=1 Tax=Patella vulgata TaxID=6465 RepID=UPI00218084F7|nr:kelch-like protein 20 isoform X2 [Patella vulgata]